MIHFITIKNMPYYDEAGISDIELKDASCAKTNNKFAKPKMEKLYGSTGKNNKKYYIDVDKFIREKYKNEKIKYIPVYLYVRYKMIFIGYLYKVFDEEYSIIKINNSHYIVVTQLNETEFECIETGKIYINGKLK